jgi:DNA replication and repair protein RecF
MYIKNLRIENFRNLKDVGIKPHPQLNFFFGVNGAGKTSLLEALVVLSRGKSFKTAQAEELVGEETGAFRIFLESEHSGQIHRLGLERSGRQWKARKDGEDLSLLSVLTRHLPLVLMEPNSHLLISGAPDGRRRFLDWGVFHVEPGYLAVWQRYSRILKQRNAALRDRQARVLDSLDEVFARSGEQLNAQRIAYFERLRALFLEWTTSDWATELSGLGLEYTPGWNGVSLHEALGRARKRDLERGASSMGPHRADIRLTQDERAIRTLLSRGEQKSFAAMLLLTQARLLSSQGELPLVLLDDLASEFDQRHFAITLENALACAGQVWVTGTAPPAYAGDRKMFHVERGAVQEMV